MTRVEKKTKQKEVRSNRRDFKCADNCVFHYCFGLAIVGHALDESRMLNENRQRFDNDVGENIVRPNRP